MNKQEIKNKMLELKVVRELVPVKDIDELNCELYIRLFNSLDKIKTVDKIQEFYGINVGDMDNAKPTNVMEGNYKYMVYLLFSGLVDKDGNNIFDTFEETLEIVDCFPKGYLNKIHNQILEINGMEGNESVKKQEEDSDKTVI